MENSAFRLTRFRYTTKAPIRLQTPVHSFTMVIGFFVKFFLISLCKIVHMALQYPVTSCVEIVVVTVSDRAGSFSGLASDFYWEPPIMLIYFDVELRLSPHWVGGNIGSTDATETCHTLNAYIFETNNRKVINYTSLDGL
jgi:hypothetical protein